MLSGPLFQNSLQRQDQRTVGWFAVPLSRSSFGDPEVSLRSNKNDQVFLLLSKSLKYSIWLLFKFNPERQGFKTWLLIHYLWYVFLIFNRSFLVGIICSLLTEKGFQRGAEDKVWTFQKGPLYHWTRSLVMLFQN